jgi:serine/threonine-protein kinase HipA
MAVGDSRHYRINTIAPRHFIQTARRAGIGEAVVNSLLAELSDTCEKAITQTLDHLPNRFPEELSGSICDGFLCLLELLRDP